MKNIWESNFKYVLFVGIVSAFIGAAGHTTLCQAEQPITLKLSLPTPLTTHFARDYVYFAGRVKEHTKGAVQVQIFPAGSLVSDPGILDAMMAGTVDIGHFMMAYLAPTMKELTPFTVPGAYRGDKYWEMEEATHPIIEKIFEKYGLKFIGPYNPGTLGYAATKKVGHALTKPEEMVGLKVRVSGSWAARVVKAWGGSPVNVPIGDIAVALQRNTIDVVITGWGMIGPLKFYESAPHVTMTTLPDTYCGLGMSGKTWDKLTQEQRASIMKAAREYTEFSKGETEKERQKFLNDIEKAGIKLYTLNEKENAAFSEAANPLLEEAAKISGPEGTKLVEIFRNFR